MAHINEQMLIEWLATGDQAAKELLYDRYAGALYNVVLQLIPQSDRANDIIVRVFIWAFHHIGTFRSSGYHTLFAWLMRKTRELAIQEALPAPISTGSELMKPKEGMMEQFYLKLPTEQQQVFRLIFFNGLTIATIARILAQPEGQVNETLGDAMRSFRQFLKENWS
ncbi:sigma-70 family RNA polymerase sigma factor [Chitinophaga sp. 180180018-2]|uniref:RNA polymerase sigma factor n=2 Tax=Chitinophaga TaxID=79328 RepID=UPI0030D13DC5